MTFVLLLFDSEVSLSLNKANEVNLKKKSRALFAKNSV